MRSFYSLSVSLIITFLHISCCLLPLLSLASLPLFNTGFLAGHQQLFTVLSCTITVWLSIRLLAFYFWNKKFHSRTEMLSYLIGWFIAISGLIINRWEPFKSERQVLAEQQFERFKSQRQLRIDLTGTYKEENLVAELSGIHGIRAGSIGLESGSLTLSYHKEKVSAGEIWAFLKRKGYIK